MRLDYHKVPLQTLHSCEHLRIRVSLEDPRGLLGVLMEGRKVGPREDRLEGRKVDPRGDRLEDRRVGPRVDRRVGPRVDHLEDRKVGPRVDRLVDRLEDRRVALRDLLEEKVVWIPYKLPVLLELGAPLQPLQRVVQGE